MVGVEPVVDLAHEMETVLRGADRAAGRLEPTAHQLLVEGLRGIETRIRALAKGEPVPPAPAALIEALAALEPISPAIETATGLELDPAIAAKLSPAEA